MAKEHAAGGGLAHNGKAATRDVLKRPKLSPDERVARNRGLLQQYGSHIVVPRSVECRIMIQMVYPLNKAIPRLRRDLGVTRTVAEVASILEPIMQWGKRATEWLRVSGGELILMSPAAGESSAERERLVKDSRAHVIVPQTDEVKQVLEQAIRMDRVLVYLRMASIEQLREDTRLLEAFALVRSLDEAVQSVCASVGVPYFSPKDMKPRKSDEPSGALTVVSRTAVS